MRMRAFCRTTLLLAAMAAAAACSPPLTDIVATAAEDVGPWDVANAKAEGDRLTADVCLHDLDEADAVSDRLLLQLLNKGYSHIQLSMHGRQEEGSSRQQVTWTREQGKQMQPGSQAADSPCTAEAPAAGGHAE
jgi:hypothetical protein